jgi:putative resolvase
MLVRIGIAAQILGVSTKPLRRWDKAGTFVPFHRTHGQVAGYIRVSSGKQKRDLEVQRQQLQTFSTYHNWRMTTVYQDVASGLNDKRPGLKRLLAACQQGHLDRVLSTYNDRLARFGTSLLEWLLGAWDVQLTRVQPVKLKASLETQLFEDLLALMTSFTGRFHRLRRGKPPPPP